MRSSAVDPRAGGSCPPACVLTAKANNKCIVSGCPHPHSPHADYGLDADMWEQGYTAAFYWAAMTITTIGYGDIVRRFGVAVRVVGHWTFAPVDTFAHLSVCPDVACCSRPKPTLSDGQHASVCSSAHPRLRMRCRLFAPSSPASARSQRSTCLPFVIPVTRVSWTDVTLVPPRA